MRYGRVLVLGVLCCLILSALYRGYLLGFTDRYMGHQWLDKRWGMVGLGVRSLEFLSLHTLAVMLSYGSALAFIVGLPVAGALGVRRASVGPVAILAAGFLGVFAIFPLTTPYLYYFGRYLVSELLPLGVICGAAGVDRLARRFLTGQRIVISAYCSIVFLSLLPSFLTRLSLREGKDFYDVVACFDTATRGKSVIFVEKKGLPETPIVTPLRLSYRKPIFSFRYADYDTTEKRDRLFSYFTQKGYQLFVLSAHERWRGFDGIKRIGKFSALFRTIGGKGSQPRRIRVRRYPMSLYRVGGSTDIPAACAAVVP